MDKKAEQAINAIAEVGYAGEVLADFLSNSIDNLEPAIDGEVEVNSFLLKQAAEMSEVVKQFISLIEKE